MTATNYIANLLADGFTPNRWDMKAHRQVEKVTVTGQRVKVCFDVDDAAFTVICFEGSEVVWDAKFTSATPLPVIVATVTAALV